MDFGQALAGFALAVLAPAVLIFVVVMAYMAATGA